MLEYLPVLATAVFLNAADVFFLQSDPFPRLHRALSFWLYLLGHVLVALMTAFLLYEKAQVPGSDWPIVTAISSLAGFSILQSLTLKFGDKGIDARELFSAWKNRVIEDVAKANTSRKRSTQLKTAQLLATRAAGKSSALQMAIHQLAGTVQQDPKDILAGIEASGLDNDLMMAQWLASIDVEFARNLADTLGETP